MISSYHACWVQELIHSTQLLILNCFATQNGCLHPSAEGKLNISHRYYKIVDIGYPECESHGASISAHNTTFAIMTQLEMHVSRILPPPTSCLRDLFWMFEVLRIHNYSKIFLSYSFASACTFPLPQTYFESIFITWCDLALVCIHSLQLSPRQQLHCKRPSLFRPPINKLQAGIPEICHMPGHAQMQLVLWCKAMNVLMQECVSIKLRKHS